MTDLAAPGAATQPAASAPVRIATLDIVRGVAVMGILAMNIVAFAMPFQAYMNPTAFGLESPADVGSWLVSFIFIDGKMRGLFSLLFGASTLLVIERAEAAGGAWEVNQLAAAMEAARPDPAAVEGYRGFQEAFGTIGGRELAETIALHHGPWTGLVHERLVEHGLEPFAGLMFFLAETLAYMLFGMAALKSGFLSGDWAAARYRRWALRCFAIAIPAYAVIAWLLISADFSVEMVFTMVLFATTPVRPLMIVAIAAAIILLTRRGGWLVDRIAAAGRAAFTNYLGTSLVMTTLFYGYGLGFYGQLSRIELWLPVLGAWVVMLLWSKPWLDRYRYGPFEWLWRSLARGRLERMRKA